MALSEQMHCALGADACPKTNAGIVRPTGQMVASADAAQIQRSATQSFSPIHFIARSHPASGYDCTVIANAQFFRS